MPRLPRFLRWLLLGAVTVVMIGGLVAGILVMRISSGLPDVQTLRTIELQEPLYVYARDGRLMGLFGEMRRYPVDIKDVPLQVKQAFLAAEDARFYQHHGVDFKGVARAIWLLATTSDKRVPGGSTITQQVARQFFLSNEYSYSRKFAEMLLAMKMERELSKDEILGLYLNTSFFGNRAYGVAAAAEFYYGKTLAQLSLDEAATLAGIPKFPSSGNPLDNPERARIRRDNYILPRMAALGFVSRAQADAASAAPMHASPHERQIEVYAPYVAEMARQAMVERFGEDVLTKGYHVTTTIDPTLQAAADSAVVEGMRVYDHRHGWRKPSRQVQIPAGADDAMIARLLRGIPTQGGLVPAVVTGTEGAGLVVVLPDASRQVLAGKAIAWAGQSAGALATRGDVVRVRRTGSDPAQAGWVLDQVPLAQAALVSLDADTGALRALVGGYSYASSKFNRATQAKRQPGSSFKPFLYAASFERGFNPASIVLDAPVVFRDRSNHVWRPKNDSGNFAGPIRLREALVQSRNLVSVRLLDAIGVDYARRYISHFGFDEASLPPNLSMSLGSASLTPLSVARGFAAFANGGFLVTPWFIDSVRDTAGHEVFREKPATACPECAVTTSAGQQVPAAAATKVDGFDFGPARTATAEPTTRPAAGSKNGKPDVTAKPVDPAMVVAPRAIDPRVAWQLQSMMRDVVKRGTATAARVLNRGDVGGKTGSTNDHRDAWFSGFGGPYATTVWVGRDDFKSLGYREYGGRAALPIWIDYMRVALKGQPERLPEPPAEMVEVRSNGVVEWLKVEDEERMRNELDVAPEDNAQPTEEAFDIF